MYQRLMAALVATSALVGGSAYAACDTSAQAAQCRAMLSEGYSALKSYTLDADGGKNTSIADDKVLSSHMSYQVVICGAEDTGFALETGSRKQVLDNKMGDKMQSAVTISPDRTSLYYLVFSLPDADTCAAAVLGVKKR